MSVSRFDHPLYDGEIFLKRKFSFSLDELGSDQWLVLRVAMVASNLGLLKPDLLPG
jgi:hypothetical protein